MKMQAKVLVVLLLTGIVMTWSCKEQTYTPKPKGYYRIDFPKKEYKRFKMPVCPYSFEIPTYATVVYDSIFFDDTTTHPCWIDIDIPKLAGEIHISYKAIGGENSLAKLVDDAYKLAYKHTIKAEYIDESVISKPESHVSGILYEIGGNAASNIQFYVTDSTTNFVRGSLYFGTLPNKDSLAPVIKFVREDLVHMLSTLQWDETKNQ